MKKFTLHFIVFLFLYGSVTMENLLANDSFIKPESVKASKIALSGTLQVANIKSNVSQPIDVYQNQHNLDVHFLFYLGTLSVSVTDMQGNTMYQTSVNALANSHCYVQTRNLNRGEYRIYICNSKGEYLEGRFKIV